MTESHPAVPTTSPRSRGEVVGLSVLLAVLSLLAGLVLNAALGWWWADSLAALAIAGLAVKEGREAWEGDSCDDD